MKKLINLLFFDFKNEFKAFFIAGFIFLLLCLPSSKALTIIWGTIILLYVIIKSILYLNKKNQSSRDID